MIFLVLYVAAVWVAAHAFRRRWPGFAIPLISVVPVFAALAWLPDLLSISVSVGSPAMAALPASYAALVAGGGLLIAAQKRRPRMGCGSCGYDLEGNTSGVCPECGAPIARPASAPQSARSRAPSSDARRRS